MIKNLNLKNLDKRISQIETTSNIPSNPLSVLNSIQNIKQTKKNNEINNFIDFFKNEFSRANLENDFGKILHFTVGFVETHISEFETIVEEVLAGNCKTQLVIDLLEQICEDIPIVGPTLESLINEHFNLLSQINNNNNQTTIQIPEIELKKKKSQCIIQ